jgi:hypothetical protein
MGESDGKEWWKKKQVSMGSEQKFTEMGNQGKRYLIILHLSLVINMSKSKKLGLDLTIYCKILHVG